MKRVEIVCIGIFVFFLVVAGVVSLTSLAGAVLPLFMAIVWGWCYARHKIAGDKAFWPIRGKKKETEKDTKKEEDELSESTEESQNK